MCVFLEASKELSSFLLLFLQCDVTVFAVYNFPDTLPDIMLALKPKADLLKLT